LKNLTELTKLRTLVVAATLTDEAKHTVLWCLDQLPKLYADYFLTYESRYPEAITKLGQAIIKRMKEPGAGEGAEKIPLAVFSQLGKMHRRLAMAPLGIKSPVAAVALPRKKREKVG
jgi:hypothetical protein